MANFNFTAEQLESAKSAKSPEELVTKAKEQGYDITLEKAAAFFDGQTAELADWELDNVAGGGCGDPGEQELKWAAEAKADGRPYKVTKNMVRDTCINCGKLASVYAAREKQTKHPKYGEGGIVVGHYYTTSYHDCKCYACMRQFPKLEK